MLRTHKTLLLSLLTLLLLGLSAAFTAACGGFFCQNTPIDQSAERIIFTVNGDGTITAIVGINYTGAAEDFSWIVPVPSRPELDVVETESLDLLQRRTQVRFQRPPNYCIGTYIFDGRGGGGGEGFFAEEGHVGPYDFAIVGSSRSSELVNWLRDNDYVVTDDMIPIIELYVKEEMLFLAMKLSQEAEVGDIQPIVITYEAENPSIPIRLTAVAAVPNMPVLTWIFAETQYVPENYEHPEPDFSDFRAPSQVATIGKFDQAFDIFDDPETRQTLFGDSGRYQLYQRRIQDEFNGQAFLTEYAGESAAFAEDFADDPFLTNLVTRFPYLTRLRAQLSPSEMTLDPIFISDTAAAEVSNTVDLGLHVDPLHYWGCSTRSAIDTEVLQNLPRSSTYIEAWNLHVVHPPDWILSEFEIDGVGIKAMSPVPLDLNTIITAYLRGNHPPMFLIGEIAGRNERIFHDPPSYWSINRPLGLRTDLTLPSPERVRTEEVRPYPFTNEGEGGGLVFGMLATLEDWRDNRAMYEAMLQYARDFQYYLDERLMHTLMVGNPFEGDLYHHESMFGYPQHWREFTDEYGIVTVVTDEFGSNNQPHARLVNRSNMSGFESLAEAYDLSAESLEALTSAGRAEVCPTVYPIVPFAREGRSGYLAFNNHYFLEVSAPPDTIADEEMLMIAESLTDPNPLCG